MVERRRRATTPAVATRENLIRSLGGRLDQQRTVMLEQRFREALGHYRAGTLTVARMVARVTATLELADEVTGALVGGIGASHARLRCDRGLIELRVDDTWRPSTKRRGSQVIELCWYLKSLGRLAYGPLLDWPAAARRWGSSPGRAPASAAPTSWLAASSLGSPYLAAAKYPLPRRRSLPGVADRSPGRGDRGLLHRPGASLSPPWCASINRLTRAAPCTW
jgi:hypothetical protein